MKPGDPLIVCDGKGREAKAVIETLSPKRATLKAETSREVAAEPCRHVTLACAVLKRENFEWVVQKATETGVRRIVPLFTERTVKTGLKMDRLRKIAREAAEQSGRGVIPEILEPVPFATFVRADRQNIVFFDCAGTHDAWPAVIAKDSEAACIVGPEGGWAPEEIALASKNGCLAGTLGPLTLRAETAAVIAAYRMVQGC